MRVVVTESTLSDLASIASFIASDNPDGARRFVLEMGEACAGLAHHAERFPRVARYECLHIRKRVFGQYLILYRIGKIEVEIVHIVHGAGDWEAIL